MSTIDIHLPEELKSYLDEQVARRGYKDASEFVQALLEAEKRRRFDLELEEKLLEAVDGPFSEWTDDDVEQVRRLGVKIVERRKAP